MQEMRCVEVDLGPPPNGIQELDRMIHRALCILGIGLEWKYGETRPSADAFRVAYYKHVDSPADFDTALKTLRQWLGRDDLVHEIDCVSAHHPTMRIDE